MKKFTLLAFLLLGGLLLLTDSASAVSAKPRPTPITPPPPADPPQPFVSAT